MPRERIAKRQRNDLKNNIHTCTYIYISIYLKRSIVFAVCHLLLVSEEEKDDDDCFDAAGDGDHVEVEAKEEEEEEEEEEVPAKTRRITSRKWKLVSHCCQKGGLRDALPITTLFAAAAAAVVAVTACDVARASVAERTSMRAALPRCRRSRAWVSAA